MSTLRIYLFGVGQIEHPAVVGRHIVAPAVKAVLGYLLLHEGRTHHRDVLATTFWPEADETSARNRLSSTLWRLRQALEPAGVPEGTYLSAPRAGGVAFNADSPHWLDVAELEAAARAVLTSPLAEVTAWAIERFAAAGQLFCPELLAGVDLPWLLLERERLTHLYFRASTRALTWHERVGEPERAIELGRQILDHDPLREEVHRALIRLYGRLGWRAAARRQFDHCRTLLAEELGVPPLAETVAAAVAAVEEGADRGVDRAARPGAATLNGQRATRDVRRAPTGPVATTSEALVVDLERAARTLDLAAHELARIACVLRGLSEDRDS